MDLSYSDEDGFENYIPTTTDPGPWLFGGTALYSVGCIVMIPILVTIKKKSNKKRKARKERVEENNGSPPSLVGCVDCVDLEILPTKSTDEDVDCDELVMQVATPNDKPLQPLNSQVQRVVVTLDGWTGKVEIEEETPSKEMEELFVAAQCESEMDLIQFQEEENAVECTSQKKRTSIGGGESSDLHREDKKENEGNICDGEVNSSLLAKQTGNIDELLLNLEEQTKADGKPIMDKTQTNNAPIQELGQLDQRSCLATIFGCTLQQSIVITKDIVKYDKESKRILRLAGPFVMSEISEVLFWALTTLLVSRYTDVDQLSAYIVTDLLIGTSETLIKGFLETLETVCSHAVGYGNNKLAGQYVQIVAALYSIFSIPLFGMWWFVMGPALRWFGLNAAAVDIGMIYTKVLIFNYYLDGIFTAVGAIPDVTNKERATNIYKVSHEVIEFAVVWALFAKVKEFDLFWMGVLQLISTLIGLVGFTAVTVKLGWFDPYWEGLTKSFALKNTSAVKYVMKMALPLSIGALFEYGEWELLTIFAASMGQAELAAWGLMESIWDLLEAFAEGFGNAGAVRVALQLGRGNIRQAKRSAWKSLFLVTILGLVITIAYGFLGDYIAVLYTSDETLQEMLKAMVPIVAFGNVFQAFGSMAWGLVGGQGRYHHATIVSSTITMSVSIPLAAFFSLAMDFPLESLVAALVIGYSTISMCLSYLLITSDWKFISDKIIEEMDDSSSSSSPSDDDDNSLCYGDEVHENEGVVSVENQENEDGRKPYRSSSSSSSSSSSTSSMNEHGAEETKTGEALVLIEFQPQEETNDQSSVEVSIGRECSSTSTSTFDGFASNSLHHVATVTSDTKILSTSSAEEGKEAASFLSTPLSVKSKGESCSSLPSSKSSSTSCSSSSSEAKKDCLPVTTKAGVQLFPQLPYKDLVTNYDKATTSSSPSSISSSEGKVTESAELPISPLTGNEAVAITHERGQNKAFNCPPSSPKSGSPLLSRSSLHSCSSSEADANDKESYFGFGLPKAVINKNEVSPLAKLKKSEDGSARYSLSSSSSSSSSSDHPSPSARTRKLYSF